ncbi:hypothetical protein CDAR_433061 [Caerostris darwini]|uniref:Uncharacterized protein n=1 Tax=Caerostris darwini TaxID=1538125 RepID=A0AAV4QK24_9ARAC|nr:hypothetical protein CDAR_433061 [Caerostris darwini]
MYLFCQQKAEYQTEPINFHQKLLDGKTPSKDNFIQKKPPSRQGIVINRLNLYQHNAPTFHSICGDRGSLTDKWICTGEDKKEPWISSAVFQKSGSAPTHAFRLAINSLKHSPPNFDLGVVFG